jgi:Rieske Fe-S protein
MDDMKLRPAPSTAGDLLSLTGDMNVNRRQFMRYGFNATSGVLAATLGALGFAAILLPPTGGGGGDSSVLYWAKGREDEAWYGAKHLQPMSKSDFESEAAKSNVGMSGAQGVWNGLPVIVNYVPHSTNSSKPLADNSPRFQEMPGYDIGKNYVGHATEYLLGNPDIFDPNGNLIMIFSRCTHLCCIPGWQLVSNPQTDDNWTPGGGDDGGSKMFCICHSSRFDPTAIEVNRNANRSTGASFEYLGIRRAGGPAPVCLPIIPIIMNGDTIEASSDYTGWLTYCD